MPTTHSSILARATRLGLLVRSAHSLRCRRQLGNQAFAHARRLDRAVAAIAQHALVHIGRQHARPGAADVEDHDHVVLPLGHRRSPALFYGRRRRSSRMRCGGGFPPVCFHCRTLHRCVFLCLCGFGLFRSPGACGRLGLIACRGRIFALCAGGGVAASRRLRGLLARSHLQDDLVVVAQIYTCEMRVLLPPFRNVRLERSYRSRK